MERGASVNQLSDVARTPEPPSDDTPQFDYSDEPRANNGRARSNGHIEAQQASRLTGINFADIKPRLDEAYIVKGLIGRKTIVADVGPSGCGKTFFICDLAMHIASGTPWRGCRVNKGLVVMVELEGAASAENRLYAANLTGRFGKDIALKLTPGPLNLRDPVDVRALIAFIREAEQEHGMPIAVCIIDTLSRALAGGDENSPEGMGELIRGADRIRLETGATLVMVHHTGKDESRGGRGHSSLYAALDTEIVVSQTGNVRVATVTKQRDLPSGGTYGFTLEVVELGRDAEGDPVTTCVVRAAETPSPERKVPAGKYVTPLVAALQEWQRQHPDQAHISSVEFRAVAKSQNIPSKRLAEVIESLSKAGWLNAAVGGFTFATEES
jgi:KaiC/GvpD/RAD55 family RecA-like ATPase